MIKHFFLSGSGSFLCVIFAFLDRDPQTRQSPDPDPKYRLKTVLGIRIRIHVFGPSGSISQRYGTDLDLPFSHKGVERTEIMLVMRVSYKKKYMKKISFIASLKH